MNKRILGLDSLRFLAIAMIIIYHCFTSTLPGGFIAVEIFFVLSGFLIGGKLVREFKKSSPERTAGLRGFIRFVFSRIWKFIPALFFCMVLTLTLAFFANRDLSTALRPNSLAAATFSTNIVSIINGTSYESALIPNLFNHTWFLALELQVCVMLYLVFAWFLSITNNHTKKRFAKLGYVCLTISILSFALMGVYGWRFRLYDRAYFGPDTHIGAFFLGTFLAILYSEKTFLSTKAKKRSPWIAVLALSLGAVVGLSTFIQYNSAKTFVIALPLVSLLTCAMIVSVNKLQTESLPKWLKPIEYIGSISFYLYLYHWPLYILFTDLLSPIMSVSLTPYMAIIVSLVLAIITDKVIMPFFRKKTPVKYIVIVLACIIPVLALIRAPEVSSIEQDIIDNTSEEEIIDSSKTQVDYINSATLSNTLTSSVMTYFGATSSFAKPKPVNTSSTVRVNWTRITQGRSAYNTPTLTSANLARLRSASVMVLGDSVALGAKSNLENYGYFVDAKGSRNMTDALNLLAGYRAANGGNLPYTIVISLITNKTTVNASLLQNIVNTAGANHKFIFVTGYCGNSTCLAYTDGTPSNRTAQNNALKSFAASHANVKVADWAAYAAPNIGTYTYSDHTHLTPAGRTAFANLIRSSI